jgi:nucleoside-diphosphate-sugar epimerase
MNIFITGSSGFVGSNLINYFDKNHLFTKYERGSKCIIDKEIEIVIHLAAKAHDVSNIIDPIEYYKSNTELTKLIFDAFLNSNARTFIFLSSVKAASDNLNEILYENHIPNPTSHYGKSKLYAEQYILSKLIPNNKKVFILRPCMIHGYANKGNLNLLYNFINKGLPWPLGSFDCKRSFCYIDNLCFIIGELICNESIPSDIYNIADDEPLSTKDLISLISKTCDKKTKILNIPKSIIIFLVTIYESFFNSHINRHSLMKLTQNYIVDATKIRKVIKKELPIRCKDGIILTLGKLKNL